MGNKPSHRYREIADTLLSELRSGRYGVGDRIPTEHALADRFCVSRSTARQALQSLELMGMIHRQRGAGTVVIRTDPQPAFVSSINSIDDLTQYAAASKIIVRRSRQALALPKISGADSDIEGPATDWLHIEGLRIQEGAEVPMCATDIFLHPDVADIGPEVGVSDLPVYRLVEDRHNTVIQSVTQTIEATLITGDVAKDLDLRPGSAGLKLVRAFYDPSGKVLEIAVNIYPAQRFAFRMNMQRHQNVRTT